MTYTTTFQFNELTIDLSEVGRVLGYEEQSLPEPFPTYLKLVLEDCENLDDISGSYYLTDRVIFQDAGKVLSADEIEFEVGRTICKELKGSTQLAFFICTAGKTISEKSAELLKGDDPVLGYVYDVLGSSIAEAVADQIQNMIKQNVGKETLNITNRYSPGYCHWDVKDQHKLFSLFDGQTSRVSLTSSALMHPVKSVSGVIGIGKEVQFRDYQCTLCNFQNCIYRNVSTR